MATDDEEIGLYDDPFDDEGIQSEECNNTPSTSIGKRVTNYLY